ncbi:MAG: hypothetical protein KGI72_05140 [Patescibacteria group bacterium]|nr:hypothetical protein [Patescibacteria group bacterium]MDE2015877.1 hypothetical protein [Patescibacteria group bacterium]MDE2233515.1 hypothetical protein [Patescibacteria group bacterium]
MDNNQLLSRLQSLEREIASLKQSKTGGVTITQDALLPGIIKERHLVVGSGANKGDLIYSDANGGFTNLGIGTAGQVATVVGGVPTWQSPFYSASYGSMYVYNLGTGGTTVTITLQDTYYQIGSGITQGVVKNFTFQNARELKASVAGTYLITFTIVVECATAAQTMEAAVMVNGTANTTIAGHSNVSTATKPVTMGATGFLTLAVGDLVSMSVLNHSGANNITIDHLMFSITRVF